MNETLDANIELQHKLMKQKTFATIGKITVVVTVVVIIAGGVSYVVKAYAP